jgi:hypothetical protein
MTQGKKSGADNSAGSAAHKKIGAAGYGSSHPSLSTSAGQQQQQQAESCWPASSNDNQLYQQATGSRVMSEGMMMHYGSALNPASSGQMMHGSTAFCVSQRPRVSDYRQGSDLQR